LKENSRFSKAILKTADWNSAKNALRARGEMVKTFRQARYLRDRVEKGTPLERREADLSVKTVFGQFADSMNKAGALDM
jgi:hypothetical protein